MTRVVFYLNVAHRITFLCQFLHRKVFLPHHTALVYGGDALLTQIDHALWEQEGVFLPHQRLNGEEITAPIVLTSSEPPPEYNCDILISLTPQVPQAFAGRFGAYVDIVADEEMARASARTRYKYFKDNGYAPEIMDMKKPRR